MTIDEDALFDEVTGLQKFLKRGGTLEEWKTSEIPVSQRWSMIVTHFKKNDRSS